MDIHLSKDELEVLEAASDFGKYELAPNSQEWEESKRMPVEALQSASKIGLIGLEVPKEKGGIGGSFSLKTRVAEELARHCFAFTFSMINTANLAATLAYAVESEVSERYLTDVLSAKIIGCTALTEPQTGSDFSAIKTSARKVDGGWILDGQKSWITNAAEASLILVYAQTDANLGWKGISGFLIDAREEGFERTEPFSIMGGNSIGVGGLSLTEYYVPDDRMISAPGIGFKYAMRSVNAARTYVSAMCCGMTEAAVRVATQYTSNRPMFGTSASEFQGLRWKLADAQTDIEAARLLTYRAAKTICRNEDAEIHAAYAKKFSASMADRHLTSCMQVMGAAGLKTEYPLARNVACARIANYVDGTTEIQNERISKKLFSDHTDC